MQKEGNENPADPDTDAVYDPTVPNLSIIDEDSIADKADDFDPYDMVGKTSKHKILDD